MPSILIIDKQCNIKTSQIDTFAPEILYKKAGFKVADGFEKRTTWSRTMENKPYTISLYAKTTGRAGQENQFEFPPPMDTPLLFGSCVLLNQSATGALVDLSELEWEKIYEQLFGGFEDLGECDTESSTAESLPEGAVLTKDGYVKDDFIVDDDDVDEESVYETDESDESSVPPVRAKKRAAQNARVIYPEDPASVFLHCTDELSEEEYVTDNAKN